MVDDVSHQIKCQRQLGAVKKALPSKVELLVKRRIDIKLLPSRSED